MCVKKKKTAKSDREYDSIFFMVAFSRRAAASVDCKSEAIKQVFPWGSHLSVQMKTSWDWCRDGALRPPERGWACTSCQHPTAWALGPHSFSSALLAGSCKGCSDDLGENANTEYFLLRDVFNPLRLKLAWSQIQHGWFPCHGFLTMLSLKL